MAKLITAVEFQKNVGQYQDEADRDPVIITRHGRPRLVLCSHARYHEMWTAWMEKRGELVDVTDKAKEVIDG
jgi:prevent-host-death family protein